MRLYFWYFVVFQMYSTYRAFGIYQNFDSWVGLKRKDKIFLAWAIVCIVAMPFFTAGYAAVEYRRRQIGEKR